MSQSAAPIRLRSRSQARVAILATRFVVTLLRTLDAMPTFTYPNRERSFVRSTVILLAVAGTGYVAGALLHNTVSSRDDSVAFARPVQAAKSNLRDPRPATGTVAAAGAVEWGRPDSERIPEPRECDLVHGISIACLFMD